MLLLTLWGCPATDTSDDTTPPDDVADTDTDADTDSDSDTDADTDTVDTDVGDTDDTDGCTPSLVFPADDGDADFVLDGTADDEFTGTGLALADLDGDGSDDLLIGAPWFDTDVAPGTNGGRVWLVYGPVAASGTLDVQADAWFDGEFAYDLLGNQLGVLGDLDADGLPEVGAFAPEWPLSTGRGLVSILFGSSTRRSGAASITTWDARVPGDSVAVEEELGHGLTNVGDLDDDGFADAAFADPYANTDAGRVYLLFGRATGLTGDVDRQSLPRIEGGDGDQVCNGTCLVGDDFDADGWIDLAIASDAYDNGENRVWFRYGDGTRPTGESVADYPALTRPTSEGPFGTESAAVGDLDGDGYPEYAVADEYNSDAAMYAGRVWVLRGGPVQHTGNTSLDTESWLTIEGVQTAGHVGSAIVGLGDVDCDGTDDLAVAGGYVDGGADFSGVVGLWLGPTAGLDRMTDATATVMGAVGDAGFGSAIAHGDLDGDGEPDLVVSAPVYGVGTGRVYVFLDAF